MKFIKPVEAQQRLPRPNGLKARQGLERCEGLSKTRQAPLAPSPLQTAAQSASNQANDSKSRQDTGQTTPLFL
jgi:hypothetical protein